MSHSMLGGGDSNTTYLRRPVSALWTYMKGKADTVYQPKGSYAAASHNHPYYKKFTGSSGKAGYIKFMTINITNSYMNQPIILYLGDRSSVGMCRLLIQFSSVSTAAATTISSLLVAGYNIPTYAVKTGDGIYDFYIKKSENYDSVVLYGYWKGPYADGVSMTFQDAHADSLPTGYITAGWGETVNRSNVSNHTDNSISIQLNGGGTEGTNKFTFNGSSAKSLNITPSSIGAATSGHDHSFMTNTEIDDLFK